MPDADQHIRQRHFVEEMGLLFEEMGGTRMVGRIFGRLLLCAPRHQSSGELAETLDVSPASVSTSTRQLLMMGLISKVPVANARGSHFAIPEGAFEKTILHDLARMRLFRDLCARGLDLLAEEPPENRRRLEELHDLYVFMDAEMPALVERWRQRRAQPRAQES